MVIHGYLRFAVILRDRISKCRYLGDERWLNLTHLMSSQPQLIGHDRSMGLHALYLIQVTGAPIRLHLKFVPYIVTCFSGKGSTATRCQHDFTLDGL